MPAVRRGSWIMMILVMTIINASRALLCLIEKLCLANLQFDLEFVRFHDRRRATRSNSM